ncbi:MAG: AMP-binding protein, partial [Deltaproteobacteria bacterium]|nr:AMP-binding protein [Deltaproteobacteria bacterium]
MNTMADPLRHANRIASQKLAIVCGDVRLSFSDLWTRCRRLAGMLDRLGLAAGDRVAILADNSHQYVEIYVGIPASGHVVVPMNTRHAEPELLYALEDSGARVLFTDRDPGRLASCVERVVRIPDEYEPLLSKAEELELGAGIG